jgi:hypothetical protein
MSDGLRLTIYHREVELHITFIHIHIFLTYFAGVYRTCPVTSIKKKN